MIVLRALGPKAHPFYTGGSIVRLRRARRYVLLDSILSNSIVPLKPAALSDLRLQLDQK